MTDRKPDAAYTDKYKQARDTKTIRFDLYLDDPNEKQLFEILDQLKKDKKLKTVVVGLLNTYFNNPEKPDS